MGSAHTHDARPHAGSDAGMSWDDEPQRVHDAGLCSLRETPEKAQRAPILALLSGALGNEAPRV